MKTEGVIEDLCKRVDEALQREGFLLMCGPIVDATIVTAPKQRNMIVEQDRDARRTVKFTQAKPREDGSSLPVCLAFLGWSKRVLSL